MNHRIRATELLPMSDKRTSGSCCKHAAGLPIDELRVKICRIHPDLDGQIFAGRVLSPNESVHFISKHTCRAFMPKHQADRDDVASPS